MFFKKKKIKCGNCNSKISESFSFCPFCGCQLTSKEEELENFGMLGKSDIEEDIMPLEFADFGVTEKIIGSLINNLAKTFEKQFREVDKDFNKTEIRSFPNGIRIQINNEPVKRKQQEKLQPKNAITQEQLKRMASLPRAEAKASVKRFSDKLVYELTVPGIATPDDVFVQKSESGYEIKAIGSSKVYTKSLPVNLPIKKFSINDNKLLVEFNADNSMQ